MECELNVLREKYIKLLENRESFVLERERFIEEKEYNTALRLAIANIPVDSKKKTNSATLQAIRKAKRLATNGPSSKKRKYDSDATEKPKRKYVRRKLTASVTTTTTTNDEHQKQTTEEDEHIADSSDHSNEADEEEDDSFITGTESDMNEDTRLTLHKILHRKNASPDKEKQKLVISDVFQ